jgi:hypothetical protein
VIGPEAQSSEPPIHNGLVRGSSPPGPTTQSGAIGDFLATAEWPRPGMWRLQATCANSRERWSANIRLTVFGNQLTWSSERGTLKYVRCPGY